MNSPAFETSINRFEFPLILFEGTRKLTPDDAAQCIRTASFLARQFPNAHFRYGDTIGRDDAFSSGMARVDPTRLEIIAPYPPTSKWRYGSGAAA